MSICDSLGSLLFYGGSPDINIWHPPTGHILAGLLQLGPDDKIYISCFYSANDCGYDYLFCDTTWNNVNTNLSVINSLDSLGAACNFQPFGFNLGGHRTYYGLPNNPNYELKADSGSACDTLHVRLQGLFGNTSNLFVYYSPQMG